MGIGMRLFSKAAGLSEYRATGAVERGGFFPNQYDLAAIALILAALVLVVTGGRQMTAPITASCDLAPISLDPANLPSYALRTTLRMFAGVIASLIFTFVFATLAAKSRKAEIVHRPDARHPAVDPRARLPDLHGHLLSRAVSRRARSARNSP